MFRGLTSSLPGISQFIIVCMDASDVAPICKTNNVSMYCQPHTLTAFLEKYIDSPY